MISDYRIRATVLLLGLVLCSLRVLGAGYKPKLTGDVKSWVYYVPGQFQNSTLKEPQPHLSQRIWTRRQVELGLMGANYVQFVPLLEKLNKGEPITIMGIGSSIVDDQSGCFHTGTVQDMGKRVGIAALQKVPVEEWGNSKYEDNCERATRGLAKGATWGNQFMTLVNKTWPHPGHVYLNNGRAGCSLQCMSAKNCLDEHFPSSLDLLIVENMHGSDPGYTVEQMVWRVLSKYPKKPRPAVLMFSSVMIIDRFKNRTTWEPCLKDINLCSTQCSPGNMSFGHILDGTAYAQSHEFEMGDLAGYYGFMAWSQRKFLVNFVRDKLYAQPPHDLSLCEALASIHMDWIHLNDLGRTLWSDVLTMALWHTEQLVSEGNAADLYQLELPEKELYYGGRTFYQAKRCGHRDPSKSVYGTDEIVSNKGWTFEEFVENGPVKKFKPGWVTLKPSSVIKFSVDADFGPDSYTELVLTFLVSYEHMGQAIVKCESGCKCADERVDAHNLVGGHMISVNEMLAIPLKNTSKKCVISVETLVTSSSGENKFKIISAESRALNPGSPLPLSKKDKGKRSKNPGRIG